MATGETGVIPPDATGAPHLDVLLGGGLWHGPLAILAGPSLLQEIAGDGRHGEGSIARGHAT